MAEDCDLGHEHGEAALALLDEQSDPLLYSFALHNVARWKLYAGRGADHEAIERGTRLQRHAAAWEVSAVPAYWARDFDDFETARRRFGELLRAFEEQGDEARRCVALAHLAVIEAMTGHLPRANELASESRDLAEQTEQETWINIALWAQGYVAAQAGDADAARAAAGQVLSRLERNPDAIVERMARDVLGVTAFAAADYEEADRQLSRADAIDASLHVREPAAERFQGTTRKPSSRWTTSTGPRALSRRSRPARNGSRARGSVPSRRGAVLCCWPRAAISTALSRLPGRR